MLDERFVELKVKCDLVTQIRLHETVQDYLNDTLSGFRSIFREWDRPILLACEAYLTYEDTEERIVFARFVAIHSELRQVASRLSSAVDSALECFDLDEVVVIRKSIITEPRLTNQWEEIPYWRS